jgi:hypothetical protein
MLKDKLKKKQLEKREKKLESIELVCQTRDPGYKIEITS